LKLFGKLNLITKAAHDKNIYCIYLDMH